MARKRSPEGRIIAYFSLEPLAATERMLGMVREIMRERSPREGTPKVKRVAARRRKKVEAESPPIV